MAIDLEKYGVKFHPQLAFGTQEAYDALHATYHAIVESLTSKKDPEAKSLSDRVKAVRAEWRDTVDLPGEAHDILTEVKREMNVHIYGEDGDVRRLEALYHALTSWASAVKGELDYEASRVANPNRKGPLGTKNEAKDIREFAENTIVATAGAMSLAMPDIAKPIVTKSWSNLPPGRSAVIKTPGGSYESSTLMFTVDNSEPMTVGQLTDTLSTLEERWTVAKLQNHVESLDESWENFTVTIDDRVVKSVLIDNGTVEG